MVPFTQIRRKVQIEKLGNPWEKLLEHSDPLRTR